MCCSGINIGGQFYTQFVTIPSAIVQTMDINNAYVLIGNVSTDANIVISSYIYFTNQTTPYIGFNHLHLFTSGQNEICATISENILVNGLDNTFCYAFSMNIKQGGFFGGQYKFNNGVNIFFDTQPTAGDGDMNVVLYYSTQNL